MAVALALTILAILAVLAGILLGGSRGLSVHFAAAGGGLLLGIAVFWILPEMAEQSGWLSAIVLAVVAGLLLAWIDQALVHAGQSPRHGVIGPLLVAAAVHSFLDGWSVRAISGTVVTDITVPLGLALHKVPEGLALGWITRRSFHSTWKAVAASAGVEFLTLVGATVQPWANKTGAAEFGGWWTTGVLSVIAGSFLFLAFHAVLPSRKRMDVMTSFAATLLVSGIAAALTR